MTSTQYHAHAWCRSFNAWADGVGGFCLIHKFYHIMTMDGGASTSTLFCLISVGNHSELHVFFFLKLVISYSLVCILSICVVWIIMILSTKSYSNM